MKHKNHRNITPHQVPVKKPTHAEIERLAHDLYERERKPDGKHLEHWFNAESMIESQFGYGSGHTEHDFSVNNGN